MKRLIRHFAAVIAATAIVALSACASMRPRSADQVLPLPHIVAHRGGAADAPENTLVAIREAMLNGADAIWLSVQLSRDGIPVLYRPADLASLTDGKGAVADHTAAQLRRLDAARSFRGPSGECLNCDGPVGIPSLEEALRLLPPDMPVVLDMKALPAEPLAHAVAGVLTQESAWERVLIYSTDASYLAAFSIYPKARLIETREATRERLLKVLLGKSCENAPPSTIWSAFELKRQLVVTERFTLGEGKSTVDATLWNPATVSCFRQIAPVRILAIAVNDAQNYEAAACLGLDAVLSDSVRNMARVKAFFERAPPTCAD